MDRCQGIVFGAGLVVPLRRGPDAAVVTGSRLRPGGRRLAGLYSDRYVTRATLSARFHRYLDVLSEGGEKFHEPADGYGHRAAARQRGNPRLRCASQPRRLGPREFSVSRYLIAVSFALTNSCPGSGRPASAKTLPLLSSCVISMINLAWFQGLPGARPI